MSINVTVTGNPISIKRGKMVTSDSYQAKKEYEKRRLIRLEQVRQQSKEIAEDVRNKVRREKKKQMHKIEEQGKQKLQNWQNRKLIELQTQYEEALQELGSGHKQATNLQDETEVLSEQKELSDKIASYRGHVAATQLQIEKNKENMKKAIPVQQKKVVRDIENTRASLVANIKNNKTGSTESSEKTRKRKKPIADISITIPSSDSEGSELNFEKKSEQDRLANVTEEPLTSSCDCTDTSENPRHPLDLTANDSGPGLVSKSHHFTSQKVQEPPKKSPTVAGGTNFAKEIHERRKLIEGFRKKSGNISPPLDTRISDRIRRRELMASQPDYCDIVAETHPTPFIESNTQIRNAVNARNINNIPVEINCICGHKCPKICGSKSGEDFYDNNTKFNKNGSDNKQETSLANKPTETNARNDIPEKPPIKLKETYARDKKVIAPSKDTLETYDSHKVNYYDHPNRFSQEKQFPSNAHVERITADSLEVNPNVMSEVEWHERMKQRDREAHIRGQRALEKERIQKDYEEMLKKLPLLQRKERICEITQDKQEYHMSEERLKDRDRKKQNELDNAYSKLFPNLKPAIVTLPSKKQDKEIRTSATDEPIQSLNIGSWDVDHEEPKMFTAEEVQEIIKVFTEQKPRDRREKLKQLLKSLKLQKEQLIDEIKSLPPNSSIHELISDLNSFSDSDGRTGNRSKKRDERKRRRDEHQKEASSDSTTESSSASLSKHGNGKHKKDKHKGRYHSDTKTPSPRKKQKLKTKTRVLILQNMSTQTTPKASTNSDQGQPNSVKDKEKSICPKLHIPCDCNKENESTDELCQIVIKLNDNEGPEVVVKSKEKDMKIPELTGAKGKTYKKPESKSIGVGTDERKDLLKERKTTDSRVASSTTPRDSEDKSQKVLLKKQKADLKTDKVESKRDKVLSVDSTDSKAKSWREQLSKNSISTSSTSYFSPPDFKKTGNLQVESNITEQSKESLYNLRKKPQQSNLQGISSGLSMSSSQSSSEREAVDPRLFAYIQKLLNMSRGSVDNLTVSSSSVQTPSQSVIEMESNNPLSQLHNVIKYFNLKNVGRDLSYSPDYSPIHYNTSASTSEVSQPRSTQEKSVNFDVDQLSKSGKTDHSSRVTAEKETSSGSAKSKDSVLAQYADITDSCSKRIAQLAAMIEQIREEKIQMLQNPPAPESDEKVAISDKDYSTAYLELPGSNDSSSKYSSINSLDDEELQRRLLDIDFSLAEKLRKFSSTKQDKPSDEDVAERPGSSKDSIDDANHTNTELWSRLKRLTQQEEQRGSTLSVTTSETLKENISFVPFLSDIPKLPKLEPQPERSRVESSTLHKRPPPSRGLTVAKKFNGNISLVPHELSTIVEADSQLSTKIGSANNSRNSQDISPQKGFQLVVQRDVQVEQDSTSTSKGSSKSNKGSPNQLPRVHLICNCGDGCTNVCSQINKEIDIRKSKTPPSSPLMELSPVESNQSIILRCSKSTTKKSIQMSSSSSDDMESIEAMLKSIGMEWAIPTLHKTKEALALTSSSSSLELSAKNQAVGSDISGSEVSLKQYLKKQIKISSSTLKSDVSPASFSGDLSELSSIQVNNSKADKSNQRTSTPIISSKSTEKSGKRITFPEGSDISSVRDEIQKHSDRSNQTSYRSLSEYSQSKSDS